MRAIILLPLILLMGCGEIKGVVNDALSPTETAQRDLYKTIAGYESVQQLAIGFKTVCIRQSIPKNCKTYLATLRIINNKANAVIQSAKSNDNNLDYTNASITLLKQFMGEINQQVDNANNGVPPINIIAPTVIE
jgi:hypothetical protein